MLIGLSLLVCAVGIGNVVLHMLARAEARAGEIGICILNGASAGQVARLVLTESALLTGVGGALGLAAAWAILRAAHDSESAWLARPSPSGSFIRNTSPVSPAHARTCKEILKRRLQGLQTAARHDSRPRSSGVGCDRRSL